MCYSLCENGKCETQITWSHDKPRRLLFVSLFPWVWFNLKIVISITLFMQTHVFNSQMVINRSWNFQKSYNKNQIFMIIAEIPKANYCSFFCFLLIIDECIINVWGYTEILAFAFVQYFPSSFKQKLSVMSLQSEWNRKQ